MIFHSGCLFEHFWVAMLILCTITDEHSSHLFAVFCYLITKFADDGLVRPQHAGEDALKWLVESATMAFMEWHELKYLNQLVKFVSTCCHWVTKYSNNVCLFFDSAWWRQYLSAKVSVFSLFSPIHGWRHWSWQSSEED